MSTAKKIIAIFAISILVIGLGVFFFYKNSLKPVNPSSKVLTKIEIPIGSSIRGIANTLEENKIIKNAITFEIYAKLHKDTHLQAGTYELSQSSSVKDLLRTLKFGKVFKEAKYKVTIPEGSQLVEIADKIAPLLKLDGKTVLQKLNDKAFVEALMAKHPLLITNEVFKEGVRYPLEGYLYPSTYHYYDDVTTLEQVIEPMLVETEKVLKKYEGDLKNHKKSVHEVLTMASLIEEEATAKVDREKIASVFYNRLKVGMRLQTDPTVLYALGEHRQKVYYKDLEVDSPYNTYRINGLPVGPIANAGEMSIEAALNPANTDFIYFLATPEGEVLFTKTLDEHNKLKAQHIK